MDNVHARAKLTPFARAEMVEDIRTQRLTLREAAASRSVSEKTARKWYNRALESDDPSALENRSSRPRRQPRRIRPQLEKLILDLRRLRKTYSEIRMVVQVSMATISKVLKRNGLNRLKNLEPPPSPPKRYEMAAPGVLIHMDIKKLGSFAKPGVRATGNKILRNEGSGYEYLHVAIDDHSRVAYACMQPKENLDAVITALRRAVAFYRLQGIKVRALMTDNGMAYSSRHFEAVCRELGIKHIFTKPYRPQTNGKAERFIQTITREWAYGRVYQSSRERDACLHDYIDTYNCLRPHSSLAFKPPISRLPCIGNNVSRYNS